MGGLIDKCTHGIEGDIAGKCLHQAKTIRSPSSRVLISAGVVLLLMFGCGLMIVTSLERVIGVFLSSLLQHTFVSHSKSYLADSLYD